MNVTLVYPCVKNGEAWGSLGKDFDSMFVNHGLASLAACLQKQGHHVKVLDFRDLNGWWDMEEHITRDSSSVFGIYVSTLDYQFAVKAAIFIRRLKPLAFVVAGGPHASICPEQLAGLVCFDLVFVGEGEVSFTRFVNNPNQYLKASSKVVLSERPVLDELPFENREVFNLKKIFSTTPNFSGKDVFRQPFVNVISGRGCVYRCGFCLDGSSVVDGKPISDIKIGDAVSSLMGKTNVVYTMKREVDDLLKIEFEDGKELFVTSEHPVYTKRGWVKAGFLRCV